MNNEFDGYTPNSGCKDVLPLSMWRGRKLNTWSFCDKCKLQVPPRAHHCNVCRVCILKRDHHCFLLGTCIGHWNQRYFIMLSIYLCKDIIFAVRLILPIILIVIFETPIVLAYVFIHTIPNFHCSKKLMLYLFSIRWSLYYDMDCSTYEN